MYLVFWQYTVKATQVAQFLQHYSEDGTWAKFFHQDEGYQGTKLFKDTEDSRQFLTIDRWNSKVQYEGFRSKHRDEYNRIDLMCNELTEKEEFLGELENKT